MNSQLDSPSWRTGEPQAAAPAGTGERGAPRQIGFALQKAHIYIYNIYLKGPSTRCENWRIVNVKVKVDDGQFSL